MKLQSNSKNKHWSIKKFTLISALSLLTFSAAHNVTAQLSTSENDEIADLLPTILNLILDSGTECSSPSALNIIRATDDGGFRSGNPPFNAIDGSDGFNGTVATRWAHNNGGDTPGTSAIITFDLESTAAVTDLSVSWFSSNSRRSFFSVETSLDGSTWTPVLTNSASLQISGVDGQYQPHDVEDTSANFVRIIGDGNDGGNSFTSINEVIINGCVGVVPSSSSSSSSTSSSSSSSTSSSSSSSSSGSVPEGGTTVFVGDGDNDTGVTLTTFDTSTPGTNTIDFGLNPNLQPWDNFDLSIWGLDSPAIRNLDGNTEVTSGSAPRGVRIDDFEFIALAEGPNNDDYQQALNLYTGVDDNDNENPESSEDYFFTGSDGGMVFKSPVDGARTSENTSFPRSELREYVRAGRTNRADGGSISVTGANENNWVLGYQPQDLILDDNNRDENIPNVGGRNGRMSATLKVNRVTVTGADDDIGSTIIGQIHAENDEPIRLYYRKLPQHDLGTIYVAHEIRRARDGDEPNDGRVGRDFTDINLVGDSSDDASASEVANGIALDELFSYDIINEGNLLIVNLYRGDLNNPIIASTTINMETIINQRDGAEDDPAGSGYDRRDEWMYYKAGAYTQNNTGDKTGFGENGEEADFDLITFYSLSVSHDENVCTQCSDID